jgi:DnaA family protein
MRSKPIAATVTSARPTEHHSFQDKDRPWNRLPVQRQLTLDLGTPPPATFDNFFAAGNHELVTRLRELEGALSSGPVADRTFYVWGEAGSGRTHLLQALVHEANGRARFLGPKTSLAGFAFDPDATLYAIDDCDRLSGAQQIALFNLFNEVRAHPSSAMVATGNAAPLGLSVREDLRTRLGWGLVFQLLPLTDEGKAAVLKHAARERGIALANGIPAYLLTHYRRDMPSLMGLLDELDRFSLEQKRAITLQLLKEMLNAKEDETPRQQADLFGEAHDVAPDGTPHGAPAGAAPENASTRFK